MVGCEDYSEDFWGVAGGGVRGRHLRFFRGGVYLMYKRIVRLRKALQIREIAIRAVLTTRRCSLILDRERKGFA